MLFVGPPIAYRSFVLCQVTGKKRRCAAILRRWRLLLDNDAGR